MIQPRRLRTSSSYALCRSSTGVPSISVRIPCTDGADVGTDDVGTGDVGTGVAAFCSVSFRWRHKRRCIYNRSRMAQTAQTATLSAIRVPIPGPRLEDVFDGAELGTAEAVRVVVIISVLKLSGGSKFSGRDVLTYWVVKLERCSGSRQRTCLALRRPKRYIYLVLALEESDRRLCGMCSFVRCLNG